MTISAHIVSHKRMSYIPIFALESHKNDTEAKRCDFSPKTRLPDIKICCYFGRPKTSLKASLGEHYRVLPAKRWETGGGGETNDPCQLVSSQERLNTFSKNSCFIIVFIVIDIPFAWMMVKR